MDRQLIDAAAQAERTALAWQRTTIATMAVGALLIHAHVNGHVWSAWPGLLLIAAAGFAALVVVPARYRRVLRAIRAGRTPLSRVTVPGTTLLLVLVTLGACAELLAG